MPQDALHVAVWRLQQLVQPMDQLHVRVAAELAEGGRAFQRLEQGGVESAKQGLARNIHSNALRLPIMAA
ncbi:hypothetical protein D9M68_742720 [compost metagenome]